MRSRSRRRRPHALVPFAFAFAFAFSAYAFTASNTVPVTHAGDGSQSISGYTVSNVIYNLNTSSPQDVDSVTFTISPASATVVKISLAGGSAPWYGCTPSGGNVSCPTSGATVGAATSLDVVATG